MEGQRYLKMLEETPRMLRTELSGVPRRVRNWTPAPGKWSIHQIVCHMRDMERDAYLARYRRILAEDHPLLPDIDGDRIALELDYRSMRFSEVLRDWRRLRRESLKLLKGVKGASWDRVGTHETDGPLTMSQLLERHAVGNDQAHLDQIRAIKHRSSILSDLEKSPTRLAKATRGLSDEALRRRPAPDKWSIVEIACHLKDTEQVFCERFTKIAYRDRPRLWIMDNHRLAEVRCYREADLSSELRTYRRLRKDTLTLLKALPHPVWQRTGIHPEKGEVTIDQLAMVLGSHDHAHLAQIHTLRTPDRA